MHLIDNSILFAEQPATGVTIDKTSCSTVTQPVKEVIKVNGKPPLDCDSGIISIEDYKSLNLIVCGLV